MMHVSTHLASLSTPKPPRSTSASSVSSTATLPQALDTPTISRGSSEIEEDVELDCDGCAKYPCQGTYDAGSHYFTEMNKKHVENAGGMQTACRA